MAIQSFVILFISVEPKWFVIHYYHHLDLARNMNEMEKWENATFTIVMLSIY